MDYDVDAAEKLSGNQLLEIPFKYFASGWCARLRSCQCAHIVTMLNEPRHELASNKSSSACQCNIHRAELYSAPASAPTVSASRIHGAMQAARRCDTDRNGEQGPANREQCLQIGLRPFLIFRICVHLSAQQMTQ